MAIHIDIYAHLRDQQLIKEGDRIVQLVQHYEDEANRRAIRGAQGRSKKIIALNDKLETSYDHVLNKIDDFINATNRLNAAQEDLNAINNRVAEGQEAQKKKVDDLEAAAWELARAQRDLIYKGQALTKSVRDETRARADLNKESSDYTKNAKAVTRLTNLNRKEFTQLARTTNKLRRETENLHSANAAFVQDNAKVAKGMRDLADATKKTTRERKKYNELRKKEGVTAQQLKDQALRIVDAHEAEDRALQGVKATMVDVIRLRRSHDAVVKQNVQSLRDLAQDAVDANMRAAKIRADEKDAIENNAALAKQFDRVGDATQKVAREYRKFNDMSKDTSVSSAALAAQVEKVNDAYVAQQRVISDASFALDDYYKKQEEAETKAAQAAEEARVRQYERDRAAFMGRQTPGQYLARNIGALTPLGTLSPSALLPVAAIVGTLGEAVVTASQAFAALPAAIGAAGAGITTLIVGMQGFGDALSGMSDPKKFAEALYQLSPNAQQAALSIKNLVDGPLGDLKTATQEALFANVSPTLQNLVQTFGPTLQRMLTSIATSFNQMFTGISLEFMTPEMQQQVTTITTNISAMFDRLRPGVSALVSAFTKITETGSGFLPQLADGFNRAMVSFDNFITRAQDDGSLQNFMQKGIDAFAALSKFLLQFGQDIYNVFGNKSPEEFMVTLNHIKDVVVVLFKAFTQFASILAEILPVLDKIVSDLGGWEVVMTGLIGLFVTRGLWNFVKWGREVLKFTGILGPSAVKAAQGVGALNTAAAVAAGGAATTAAAKKSAATTSATFAAAGTNAGKGFASKLGAAIKSFSWNSLGIGVGLAIASPILNALDSKFHEWIASKQDNPQAYRDQYNRRQEENFFPDWVPFGAFWENVIRNGMDAFNPNFNGPPLPPNNFYKDWYPAGENPAIPIPPDYTNYDMPSGYEFPLPDTVIDPKTGKALTESELLNKIRGELPRESYAVDPFTNPITGQKITPMLPMGPNGMPEYPTGGTPGTPSIQGPVMPQYNSFGQFTGYGANMVDPEEVFDAQLAVVDRATDLEEANKDLLAAKRSGLLSEEEIHDLERKVLDGRLQLHKALVGLGEAQAGDVEKLKTETENARDALGNFGAEIDKDFGISKGLTGIAENITKFLANLAFAPVFGAIRGAQAGLGFPQGEGAGSGLAGMAASSMGYYKNGPLDPGREQVPASAPGSYAPTGYTPNWYTGGVLDAPVSPRPASASDPSAWVGGAGDFGTNYEGGGAGPARFGGKLPGINLNTIPVAVQQYANNCINAAAQIVLSAGGVNMSQDELDSVIARGGGISSLSAGLNRLNPSGGYTALDASGGSPDALFNAVKNSIDRGVGSVLNVAPGSSIAGRDYPYGHFIAVTGYDPRTGRINLSDTGDGSMYSVSADEAFRSSRGRGLVAGTGVPQQRSMPQQRSSGPILGPPLPRYATGGEVPIIAHSGEHVLTRDDVAAMGGQAAVYNFRRGLHSYAVGGAVPRTPAPPPLPPALEGGGVRGLSGVAADMFGRGSGAGSAPFNAGPKRTSPPSNGQPSDLGSLLGVGDSPPPKPAPPPPPQPPPAPAVEAPELSPPLAAEAPVVPVPPAVPTVPETAMPAGVETPGTVIGSQVEAPAGYGEGFSVTGGGLVGLAQSATLSAIQAAGMAGDMGGGMGGGTAGAAVASAALQMAFEQLNRGIEYGAQVAAIGMQGLSETFLPAGGSELAQNNWGTRLLGGIAGAAPAIANLAGGQNASNQSTLAGVGGPPTPEQIAAQGMDPNRTQHTGAGAPAGPVNNIGVQIMEYRTQDNRPASQDFGRYAIPGQR